MIYCDVSHNYFLYLFSLCFIIDPSYYYKNICKADYLTCNLNPFNAAYFVINMAFWITAVFCSVSE